MEAKCYFQTSVVDFERTVRCYVPEDQKMELFLERRCLRTVYWGDSISIYEGRSDRRLDKTKFLNLYSVSNIVRVIGLRTRER
jgi:hypothetical protein